MAVTDRFSKQLVPANPAHTWWCDMSPLRPQTGNSHPLELGDAEEHLHDAAQVAAVAQVLDPRVTRAVHRLQLGARLLDHLPLARPRPRRAVVVVCVMTVLRLLGAREGERAYIYIYLYRLCYL